MHVRFALETEVGQLARVWYDAWQDGHAGLLPAELVRDRTLERFRDRLQVALPEVRVVGPPGAPTGFCLLKGDELYQLFVAAAARGTGAATALIADAEQRLREKGVETAWLACAIGNHRAARFYEKSGWHRVGNMVSELATRDGMVRLEVWRYEKALA